MRVSLQLNKNQNQKMPFGHYYPNTEITKEIVQALAKKKGAEPEKVWNVFERVINLHKNDETVNLFLYHNPDRDCFMAVVAPDSKMIKDGEGTLLYTEGFDAELDVDKEALIFGKDIEGHYNMLKEIFTKSK